MTLTELYDISESENVPVYSFQMNECESISVLQDGNCFVAIDPMKLQSETEEKEKLSHELCIAPPAHFITDMLPAIFAKGTNAERIFGQ